MSEESVESDGPKRLKRRNKFGKDSDKASNASAAQKKKKKSSQNSAVNRFFEDEAELGSDDEENDNIRKAINKNDAEEDEDGLDEDLKDFVVEADENEIGEAEHEALIRYQMDLQADEKEKTKQVMEAVVFGRNKKRARGDVEGGFGDDDEMNDFERRKQERL